MASATTSDFVATATKAPPPFSLIEQKGLPGRLAEELARAWRELTRDPRGFIRDLFADDTRDAKRRRRLYFGLAGALAVHAILLTVIAMIGWRSLAAPQDGEYIVHRIDLPARPTEEPTEARSKAPPGDNGTGGGGGEVNSPPVTKGAPPPTSPAPPIVKPLAPPVEHPALPVMATIKGPESTPPPVTGPIGLPNGATDAPPAPGEGKGNGIGGRDGSGAGSNDGPGGGRNNGTGSNPNGSRNGVPNGTATPTDILFTAAKPPGYVPYAWLQRVTPMVTPEAQEHKAAGRLFFKATINIDGTLTDIEVIQPVDYMTESAIEALRRARFRPASINGVPITVRRVPLYIDVHY